MQAASISAIQTETGLTRKAVINRSGEYLLLELPLGHYSSHGTAQGFETYIRQGIVVDVNETASIPIRLVVGAETLKLAEFFNLLNHTNLRLPDSDISSPTFNQVLAALPPRLIQLALKFQF